MRQNPIYDTLENQIVGSNVRVTNTVGSEIIPPTAFVGLITTVERVMNCALVGLMTTVDNVMTARLTRVLEGLESLEVNVMMPPGALVGLTMTVDSVMMFGCALLGLITTVDKVIARFLCSTTPLTCAVGLSRESVGACHVY